MAALRNVWNYDISRSPLKIKKTYYYALQRVSAVRVSVLNYVNTIIAIFLGWLLLDEVITLDFIIAAVLIMSGVFIINYKRK